MDFGLLQYLVGVFVFSLCSFGLLAGAWTKYLLKAKRRELRRWVSEIMWLGVFSAGFYIVLVVFVELLCCVTNLCLFSEVFETM